MPFKLFSDFNLKLKTNRQLVKCKLDANVAIKNFTLPPQIKQTTILLRNLELVKAIDEEQAHRHLLATRAFYEVSKELRPKKITAFKAVYFAEHYPGVKSDAIQSNVK